MQGTYVASYRYLKKLFLYIHIVHSTWIYTYVHNNLKIINKLFFLNLLKNRSEKYVLNSFCS